MIKDSYCKVFSYLVYYFSINIKLLLFLLKENYIDVKK